MQCTTKNGCLALSNWNVIPIEQHLFILLSPWLWQPLPTPSPWVSHSRLFMGARVQSFLPFCTWSSYLTQWFLTPHTSWQTSGSSPLCMRLHFLCVFISWWIHRVTLYLAIINNTTTNQRMQVGLGHSDFCFFRLVGLGLFCLVLFSVFFFSLHTYSRIWSHSSFLRHC